MDRRADNGGYTLGDRKACQWIRRRADNRAIEVTDHGRVALNEIFHLSTQEHQ